jgi:hypothetical protein
MFIWVLGRLDFVDRFTLDQLLTGTGGGQFTAWLGEKNVQSFVVELPPNEDHGDYESSELCDDSADASNSFRPSSSRVRALADEAAMPLFWHLVEQSYAPGCATEVGTVYSDETDSADAFHSPDPAGSVRIDCGLVAAKIGREAGRPGRLSTFQAQLMPLAGGWTVQRPAFDYLAPTPAGETDKVFYWVQNYGQAVAKPVVEFTLRSRAHDFAGVNYPTLVAAEHRMHKLGTLKRAQNQFEFRVEAGNDYELRLSIRRQPSPFVSRDQVAENDEKIFTFTTANPFNNQ